VSSNDSNPGFAFPRLYRQWINHDLKYDNFMAVRFDWSSPKAARE